MIVLEIIMSLFKKSNRHLLFTILMLVCVVATMLSVNSCQRAVEREAKMRSAMRQNIKAINDRNQKLMILAEKKDAKDDSTIAKLQEQLDVKPKQVIEYVYIKIEKEVHDTIHDSVYLPCATGEKLTHKFDDCLKVEVDFLTDSTRVWSMERSMEITDVSYYKRPHLRLFGKERKALPKWGKKTYYQTLITNCEDTIVENRKVTFQKQ